MKLPISVIILTYNEEKNVEDCIASVIDWVQAVYVVDSYSSDNTLQIVKQYTDNISQHPFVNYSEQRNWALASLPLTTEWVLNLDADHRVEPSLRNELVKLFSSPIPAETNGFLITRKMVFMGKWLSHGGLYPTYHNILFKKGFGKCEQRLYDQHFFVKGDVSPLSGSVINVVTDSLSRFTERHNKWASFEAYEQLLGTGGEIEANIAGNKIQQRRALRAFYNQWPLFVRPFVYFFYRYIIKVGFMDGVKGLIYHFLQGFWYRFLVDAKIYEIQWEAKVSGKSIEEVVSKMRTIAI